MQKSSFVIALGAAALMGSAALAAPVSPTTLMDGVAVTETVNIEDDSGLLNDANWFIFFAEAGDLVDIDINRLAAPPDLIAELYFGNVTGLDFGNSNADAGSGNASPLLTFLDVEDDTEDDAFGGPFGDPRFTFTAAETGTYSIAVTRFFTNGANEPFEIIGTGISPTPIPLPASGLLLVGALGGVAAVRRKS